MAQERLELAEAGARRAGRFGLLAEVAATAGVLRRGGEQRGQQAADQGYRQESVPPPAATAPVVPAFTYCHWWSGRPPTQ